MHIITTLFLSLVYGSSSNPLNHKESSQKIKATLSNITTLSKAGLIETIPFRKYIATIWCEGFLRITFTFLYSRYKNLAFNKEWTLKKIVASIFWTFGLAMATEIPYLFVNTYYDKYQQQMRTGVESLIYYQTLHVQGMEKEKKQLKTSPDLPSNFSEHLVDTIRLNQLLFVRIFQILNYLVMIFGMMKNGFTKNGRKTIMIAASYIAMIASCHGAQKYYFPILSESDKMERVPRSKLLKNLNEVRSLRFGDQIIDEIEATAQKDIAHDYRKCRNYSIREAIGFIHISMKDNIAWLIFGLLQSENNTHVANIVEYYQRLFMLTWRFHNCIENWKKYNQFTQESHQDMLKLCESNHMKPEEYIQDGEIRFVNVTCGEREFIRDFNLTIPKGKLTTFRGENKIGKSTLLQLLSGALKPTFGQIFIGDTCISDTHQSINSRLPYLFDGDVSEEFYEALSSGQRQMKQLEAILEGKHNIILLDEALNALDHDNAITQLKKLKATEKTVIHITHDPSLLDAEDEQNKCCFVRDDQNCLRLVESED